jgi:hypothetical protein
MSIRRGRWLGPSICIVKVSGGIWEGWKWIMEGRKWNMREFELEYGMVRIGTWKR